MKIRAFLAALAGAMLWAVGAQADNAGGLSYDSGQTHPSTSVGAALDQAGGIVTGTTAIPHISINPAGGNTATWSVGADLATDTFHISNPTIGTNDWLVILPTTGEVGLGTSAPTSRLYVQELNSLEQGIFVSQSDPDSGALVSSTPLNFNVFQSTFHSNIGSSAGNVSALHAQLGVGGPNLDAKELWGATFSVIQTATDNSGSDKVGAGSSVSISYPSPGRAYGFSPSVTANSGATTPNVYGEEIDLFVHTGATVTDRIGLNLWNGGELTGTNVDSAIAVSNSGSASATGYWNNIITLYKHGGSAPPMSTTGNFFFSDSNATVANIFNLGNVTVTGDILKFPNVEMTGSGMLGLGVTAGSRLDFGNSLSVPSWTTSGAGMRARGSILTDTTGSGTIGTRVAYSFGVPTFASTNPVTITGADTVYIGGPPTAGTNTTITQGAALAIASGNVGLGTTQPNALLQLAQTGDSWSNGENFSRSGAATANLWLDANDNTFNIGRNNGNNKNWSMDSSGNVAIAGSIGLGGTSGSRLALGGSFSVASWPTNIGAGFSAQASTYTDTTGSGTVVTRGAYTFGVPTFASSNAVTVTGADTVIINGPPTAGANTTITQPAALAIISGNVGINNTAPNAQIQIAQAGDDWSNGINFSRAAAATADLWLDANDNTFNIGRNNADNKYWSMDSSGNVTLSKALTVQALPASAGAGGLYVCVDSAGVMYKKASCP